MHVLVESKSRVQVRTSIWMSGWEQASRNVLFKLDIFLAIATNQVDDVRDVLVHYSQFDDPLQTFKEKQRMLMVSKSKH